MIWLIVIICIITLFPTCQRTLKEKYPLTPPKEENRKTTFPLIIKDSNLSVAADLLYLLVSGSGFRVSGWKQLWTLNFEL